LHPVQETPAPPPSTAPAAPTAARTPCPNAPCSPPTSPPIIPSSPVAPSPVAVDLDLVVDQNARDEDAKARYHLKGKAPEAGMLITHNCGVAATLRATALAYAATIAPSRPPCPAAAAFLRAPIQINSCTSRNRPVKRSIRALEGTSFGERMLDSVCSSLTGPVGTGGVTNVDPLPTL
jgi:hypothetical protein